MSFIRMDGPQFKAPRVVSKPMTDAANGQTCALRIPGVCNGDPATTVACHVRIPGNAGTGMKPDDLFVIDGCAECHRVMDNRALWESAPIGWDDVLRALIETQRRRLHAGLITLKGAK